MEPQEPMTTEPAEPVKMRKKSEAEKIRVKARSSKEEDERMTEILKKFWKRQASSVLPKIGAKSASWWDEDRWDDELAEDITPLINSIADAHGKETAEALGFEYDGKITRKYLEALAKGRAHAINAATYKKLMAALEDEEDEEDTPSHVFDVRQSKDSLTFGRMLALAVAGWAATHEAPKQARDSGIMHTVEKMWVTGDNPRPEHAMMNGETVPIDKPFSNGCEWPGDEGGDPDTTCGCNCSTEVIISF